MTRIIPLMLLSFMCSPAQSAWPKLIQCRQVLFSEKGSEFPKVIFKGPVTEEQRAAFMAELSFVDLYAGVFARPPRITVYVDQREDDHVAIPGFRSLLIPMTDAIVFQPAEFAFEKRELPRREIWFQTLMSVYFLEQIHQEVPQMRKIMSALLGGSRVRDLDRLARSHVNNIQDFLPSFKGGAPWYDRDRWRVAAEQLKDFPAFVKTAVSGVKWQKSQAFWLLNWLVPQMSLYSDLAALATNASEHSLAQLVSGYEGLDEPGANVRFMLFGLLERDPELQHYAPELLAQDIAQELRERLAHPELLTGQDSESILDKALLKRIAEWNSETLEVSP